MDASRRFFLGGAISLAAAVTFKVKKKHKSNIPTIYGDGKHDDTGGIGALFRNEPVNFNSDQIGVESHGGITFHKGVFIISRTIDIPREANLEFERVNFVEGEGLTLPFFRCFVNASHQIAGGTRNTTNVIFNTIQEGRLVHDIETINGELEDYHTEFAKKLSLLKS